MPLDRGPVSANGAPADDSASPIVQEWRKQIYDHVQRFLKPGNNLLELNAGTGIDALYFAKLGYTVHATDQSKGMVEQLMRKISLNNVLQLSCQQVSFQHLGKIEKNNFDYVFSNFGGLNCIHDLSRVTLDLPGKIKPGAYVTWVVMPPFCPWELLRLLQGNWGEAFRRFHRGGATAHLEGEYFQTYYHSLSDIRKALGNSFTLVRSEGLGVFSAPPAATRFYKNYSLLYRTLRKIDLAVKDYFPFNRWGDHIIVTFQFSGR
jgi:hypothetical protein